MRELFDSATAGLSNMNNADSSRLAPQMLAELRPLWRIAWPLLIAQTAQIGTGVIDTLMAGNYSDADLAAIAVGFNIWLPLYLIILGTLFACSATVAQDFGAGRIERVSFLPQGLWVAVALSAVMTPLCLNSDVAIALLGLPEETAAKTSAYVSVGSRLPRPWHLYGASLPHSRLGHYRAVCLRERGGVHRQRATELHADIRCMGRT